MAPSSLNPLFLRIRDAARRIESIGAGNPRLEAEYLMAAALGMPRIRLWLVERPPQASEFAAFDRLLDRRLAREPLQYVLGTAEFAGIELQVGPGVLIPRSETEILVEQVEEALRAAAGAAGASGSAGAPAVSRDLGASGPAPLIVDVGTGSGAILLALLRRIEGARGIGIDAQEAALAWARRNAERLAAEDADAFPRLKDRVEFLLGDLLEPLGCGLRVDAVVSNPPYVRLDERPQLAPEIRDHEPPEALFAGEDGLELIRRLIPQAEFHLAPGGLLALEIGITQGDAVRGLLAGGAWKSVEVRPDLTGRPRIVLARRA